MQIDWVNFTPYSALLGGVLIGLAVIPFPVQKDIERGCELLSNAADEIVACRLCRMRLRQSHLAHARRSVAGQRCQLVAWGWSLRGIGRARRRIRHPRIMSF